MQNGKNSINEQRNASFLPGAVYRVEKEVMLFIFEMGIPTNILNKHQEKV